MIAVNGNKEVKIVDIQKDEYLEKGYTILDDKLKVIAKPFDKSENKIADLEKKIKELEQSEEKFKESQVNLVKENETLKSEKAELEKKIADLEKKIK